MRARPIGRALRFVVPALAAASVAAAGGSVAAPARAGESGCVDGAVPTGDPRGRTSVPCADTVAPPPTPTETDPAEEPPQTTDTVAPPPPPPVVTTTTPEPPAPAPAPARTKRRAPAKKTASASSRRSPTPTSGPVSTGGIFSGGAQVRPPENGTPKLSGGPYVFPVIGRTSFSDTWGAPRATVAWHHGVDILAALGSPIVAVADGVLFSVGWNTIGGRRLWLRDRDGNYFYYAHLSAFSRIAADGARVRAGTVIGYVGDTGDAAGGPYHLHFEIHPVSLLALGYDGAVDPFPYVSSWRALDHALDGVSTGAGERFSSAAGPPPGAFLIGFTDISSASGLSPASLDDALDAGGVSLASVYAASRQAVPAPRREHAQIARLLDTEAARAARSVWDGLAACESGGDWGANTGNGYIGGLQFLPQTWASHGGTAFAPSPQLATREQQIVVAKRVLESQGWRAWPACSAMLGLGTLADE